MSIYVFLTSEEERFYQINPLEKISCNFLMEIYQNNVLDPHQVLTSFGLRYADGGEFV